MRFIVWASGFMLMVAPFLVSAQAPSTGFVMCGTGTTDYNCDTAAFVKMIDALIKFLITSLSLIAVILLVYAGFKMVTSGGDEGAWKLGKTIFTNVVIGIIIVLAAWLIVDLVLKQLTDSSIDNWVGCLTGALPCPSPNPNP